MSAQSLWPENFLMAEKIQLDLWLLKHQRLLPKMQTKKILTIAMITFLFLFFIIKKSVYMSGPL